MMKSDTESQTYNARSKQFPDLYVSIVVGSHSTEPEHQSFMQKLGCNKPVVLSHQASNWSPSSGRSKKLRSGCLDSDFKWKLIDWMVIKRRLLLLL